METVILKTVKEEVMDNHMSGLGIPQLGLITSLSRTDQLEQNMQLHNIHFLIIRFYNKFKNSKKLRVSLKSSAMQIHQISIQHRKSQRIKSAKLQFLSAASKENRQMGLFQPSLTDLTLSFQ